MIYDEFIAAVDKYRDLFESGLKKQANKYLFEFTDSCAEIPREELDAILERFCRECIDGGLYAEHRRGNAGNLPFQLTRLLDEYLKRQSALDKMPHMRWAYQLFGRYYNPHDPQNEHPAYRILERAYNHRERDLKTAELFLEEQLSVLEFGAHHFPDGCCIERSAYREAVTLAEKILTENNISQGLADELDYYRRLYTVWYEWFDSGRQGDFAEKCRAAGLKWEEIPAYYYS